jgi:ferredoxin
MTTGARLRVNPIACDGRGLCAEVLPELITLDDWGFPVIRDGGVPPGLLEEAAEAVRLCPRLALRLDHPAGTPAGSRQQAGRPRSGP